MKHILENERFQITVSDHGAELTGIYDKEKQHQILWQADPAFWNVKPLYCFPMWAAIITIYTALTAESTVPASMALQEIWILFSPKKQTIP